MNPAATNAGPAANARSSSGSGADVGGLAPRPRGAGVSPGLTTNQLLATHRVPRPCGPFWSTRNGGGGWNAKATGGASSRTLSRPRCCRRWRCSMARAVGRAGGRAWRSERLLPLPHGPVRVHAIPCPPAPSGRFGQNRRRGTRHHARPPLHTRRRAGRHRGASPLVAPRRSRRGGDGRRSATAARSALQPGVGRPPGLTTDAWPHHRRPVDPASGLRACG